MLQNLDDPIALPPLTADQRRAVLLRGTRMRRRRRALQAGLATGVGVAAAAVAVVVFTAGSLHQAGPVPPAHPSPTPATGAEAERIIADGTLESFAATESGTVLTIWGTCHDVGQTDCGYAWRLGSEPQPQATGMVGRGDAGNVLATASGDGFVLTPAGHDDLALRVAQDGDVSPLPLSRGCQDVAWSTSTTPGQLVWGPGLNVIDTGAGSICDTGQLGGRSLAEGVFTADGTLWALLSNESDPSTLAIGRYDGVRWRYHDLAANGGSWTSVLAAAGSNVVVLEADSHLIGLSVSNNAGATWSEETDPESLARDLPFTGADNSERAFSDYTSMAFAGTSVLYVADASGNLWRSTDFATFSHISAPGSVSDLKSAGDGVIARLGDGTDLVRISADGSMQSITVRRP